MFMCELQVQNVVLITGKVFVHKFTCFNINIFIRCDGVHIYTQYLYRVMSAVHIHGYIYMKQKKKKKKTNNICVVLHTCGHVMSCARDVVHDVL